MVNKKNPDKLLSDVRRRIADGRIQRLYYFSFILAVAFSLFAFTSLVFIRQFRPELSVLQNLWPRLLFGCIPFLGLAFYLKKGKQSSQFKLWAWIVSFCVFFDLTSMIQVWPIAWEGGDHTSILLYVNAINNSLFAAVALTLALSFYEALIAFAIQAVLVWVPLFVISFQSESRLVPITVINDTMFLTVAAMVCGMAVYKVLKKLAILEAEKENAATRFLGPLVSKAIFENKSQIFERRNCKAFVVSVDIRDSTELLKIHQQKWLDFRRDYFILVGKAVNQVGGHIQKTMGDCHIINFGVFDFDPDLSDIPGLETDEILAEENRLRKSSQIAFACLDEIFRGFDEIAHRHFPTETLRLGAGIDKGLIERALQGGAEQSLELDVNGDPVNCSNRLQEYSKVIRELFNRDASLLVVSPFAADYLDDLSHFQKVYTTQFKIRNYQAIRWVYVQEYIPNHQLLEKYPKRAA